MALGGFVRGARYLFPSATMLELIASAYGVGKEKVSGGPSWIESDRFDVVAKVPPGTTNETARLMLRSLLADRFKLAVHNANVVLSVYALASGGKPGPELKQAKNANSTCRKESDASAADSAPLIVVTCQRITMSDFATNLRSLAAGYLDKPVVDSTNLPGERENSRLELTVGVPYCRH